MTYRHCKWYFDLFKPSGAEKLAVVCSRCAGRSRKRLVYYSGLAYTRQAMNFPYLTQKDALRAQSLASNGCEEKVEFREKDTLGVKTGQDL